MNRYATSGPALIVPARTAALLARILGVDDRLRVRLRGQDPELDEVLLAWRAVQLQFVADICEQGRFQETGTVRDETRNSPDTWDANEVAARANCTGRGVRTAAGKGQLVGSRDNAGRWRFTPEEVAMWMATRTKE